MAFPKKAFFLFLGLFLLFAALQPAFAQKRLRWTADKQARQRINGETVEFLLGNVKLRQDETLIWADSARIEGKSAAQAFGNIRIKEGDSVDIKALRLYYNGRSGLSQLRENVVYTDGKATLFTDNLDYNKSTGVATYFNGGRMIDEENTLTSDYGTFHRAQNQASFFGNVKVVGPDGTITSDTLYYNTLSGQVTTRGPTHVVRSDGTISDSETGIVYNMQTDNTVVKQGRVETQDYIILGNTLTFDKRKNIFRARDNVRMTAKNDDVIITGEEAIYYRDKGITYVLGNPVMRRPVEGDTLYLRADTLYSVENQVDTTRFLYAYPNVRIYKSNLQGRADSLVYNAQDTLLTLYSDPVLWSEENQMSGDTVMMYMENQAIDRMEFHNNGFVVSVDTLGQYNQVKGRKITAWFGENELEEVLIDGNAESIYHVLTEESDALMGMNRMTSGSMRMFFEQQKLHQLRMYNNPDARFVPPHELQAPDAVLPGFRWREEERPNLAQVLGQEPLVPAAEKSKSEEAGTETGANKSKPEAEKAAGRRPASAIKSIDN
jgi:lipopolysaccharide export system protein LptA